MRELPLAYLRSSNSYTFEEIAPGNYLVLAYDSRQELEYRNPEALRQLLSLGKTVTVPPNGEATAEVEVIQTSEGEK